MAKAKMLVEFGAEEVRRAVCRVMIGVVSNNPPKDRLSFVLADQESDEFLNASLSISGLQVLDELEEEAKKQLRNRFVGGKCHRVFTTSGNEVTARIEFEYVPEK